MIRYWLYFDSGAKYFLTDWAWGVRKRGVKDESQTGLSYWKDAIAEMGRDEGVDLGKKIRRLVLGKLSL